ncbi:MAG: NAD(P)-binding domain-containing protein [Dehalococcoidia bacterium]|nr:NAD(P)-binding domain-containing protein [Dehalococcoidia bacterium]
MNMFLLAADTDPVAKAVESLLSNISGVHRVTAQEFAGIDFGSEDVLLLGENGTSNELISEAELPPVGMIQHLGCMPSPALLSIASGSDSQVIVAGISPNIAPRVANRVIGFTGPLTVRPLPDWGVIGVGEVGVEVVKKALATRSSVGIAEIRTPRSGLLTELGVRRHSLDLLVAGSDVVTIHVHAGSTTSPLISDRELGLMKSDAVLINTSNSSVVHESAVIEALECGEIAGYATDCPGDAISTADESLAASGKLIVTTNPLTNQIGAPQQLAKYVLANAEAFKSKSTVRGIYEPIDFPTIGDPSFWSSRMSPRQD